MRLIKAVVVNCCLSIKAHFNTINYAEGRRYKLRLGHCCGKNDSLNAIPALQFQVLVHAMSSIALHRD